MTVDADKTPLPLPCELYPQCALTECMWPECGVFNAVADYLAKTHEPYDVEAGLARLQQRLEDPE